MALTITKPDKRGRQTVVAEEDMYLDATGSKVIVVKQGEEVPREAASVLAGRGGRVPARYAKMVEEAGAAVKVLPEAKAASQPAPQPQQPKAVSQPTPAKPEKTKEPATT